MRVEILALALAACGRIGFEPRPGDAGTDVGADTCTLGPWGPPVAIGELNTTFLEYGPQLSSDGLTLYFDSNRAGDEDLYVATRPSRTAPFGMPVRLANLTTANAEGDPSLSTDALELMYDVFETECLMDARRATTTDPFGTPTQTLCNVAGPSISRDGLTLYYSTILDTYLEGHLAVTTRASLADQFGAGAEIAELATGATKGYPSVSADELTMYFESGHPLDLYETTRASPTAPWGAPAPLTEINTPMEEGDVSISDDGTELFFESDRASTPDLFHSTRSCQ